MLILVQAVPCKAWNSDSQSTLLECNIPCVVCNEFGVDDDINVQSGVTLYAGNRGHFTIGAKLI